MFASLNLILLRYYIFPLQNHKRILEHHEINHKLFATFLFEIQDLPGGASSAPPQEIRSVKVVSIAAKPTADAISSDVEEVLRSVGQLLVEVSNLF